jgi:hypothetical protein
MWPLFCVQCIIEGKPIPEFGTRIDSPRIKEMAAVIVWKGDSLCHQHMLQVFVKVVEP